MRTKGSESSGTSERELGGKRTDVVCANVNGRLMGPPVGLHKVIRPAGAVMWQVPKKVKCEIQKGSDYKMRGMPTSAGGETDRKEGMPSVQDGGQGKRSLEFVRADSAPGDQYTSWNAGQKNGPPGTTMDPKNSCVPGQHGKIDSQSLGKDGENFPKQPPGSKAIHEMDTCDMPPPPPKKFPRGMHSTTQKELEFNRDS